MKSNKTKAKLAESLLRRYIQKEIRKIMEADEESTEETPTDAPAEEPTPEETPTPEPKKKEEPKPEPKPEPAPEEEVGLNQDFQDAMDQFVQKLKTSTEPVEQEDLVTMVGDLVSMFVASSEGKLKLLQAVKSNIVQ